MERLFRRKKQKGETVKNKKKNRRKQRRKVILILLAVLVLGLVVIFGLFRVRKLVISGNKQYKAEEIQEAIMQDGLCKNSLYLLWKFSDQAKVKESIPFLNGAEAKLRTPFEVQVTVKEKQQIGYLLNQGSYIYFDKDGMIVEISDQPSEDEIGRAHV